MAKVESNVVLVIDDDDDFREIFSTKLKAAGLAVETAPGGAAGLEKAEEVKPKLIMLDMQMPKLSGADVLLKLKESKKTKDAIVVFLTSYGDEAMLEQERLIYSQMGARDYIKKTDDLDALVEKVKSYL